MFGVYSHLTNRLILEVLGPTKNDRDLAIKAIRFHEKLAKLNQEMREHEEDMVSEEECDVSDWFLADEEFLQKRQDITNLECEWPIIEVDVPKMAEKLRKRGLGKKGRLLAERRYVASRANKVRIAHNSATKKGKTADAKWMTARLRRSVREIRGLDVSFAEMTQRDIEEKNGLDLWKLRFVPTATEENLVTDCYHSRFFLKNGLQFAEIPPLNDNKDNDSDESHQTEEEDVHDEEEDLEPRCMRTWGEY